MTQRIDQCLQTLILSSFQALPIPLPQFHQLEGTPIQLIQKHQENLAIAQRLLQIHQLQAYYALVNNIGQPPSYKTRPTSGTQLEYIEEKQELPNESTPCTNEMLEHWCSLTSTSVTSIR